MVGLACRTSVRTSCLKANVSRPSIMGFKRIRSNVSPLELSMRLMGSSKSEFLPVSKTLSVSESFVVVKDFTISSFQNPSHPHSSSTSQPRPQASRIGRYLYLALAEQLSCYHHPQSFKSCISCSDQISGLG